MRLLVIGGGRFVGRHLVEAALAAGHAVTVFNRGLSGQAPWGVEHIAGDRRTDLGRLAGRSWDAVVDT
ncbi:NAD-dependent epimerase/dehydratase family protein, partial [Ideonella sp.]|uniref:NAD-dependent epimerase/dehydratase family protein n=1 Tax=Ideonella sp. TaxID=1929293 RepID=UPI003BB7F7D7